MEIDRRRAERKVKREERERLKAEKEMEISRRRTEKKLMKEEKERLKAQKEKEKKENKFREEQKRECKGRKRKATKLPCELSTSLCTLCGGSGMESDKEWVACDSCNSWWHILCTDNCTYSAAQLSAMNWYCSTCKTENQ